MKYTKSYEGIVSQEDEEVTSAMCIPLVSKKKTSPGAPDWTCVILGFIDGQVKMYTENGSLLISQMFHNQPVKAIKCRSYQPAATAMKHDQLEEVFILYQTVLVTMDGFGLFQTLRGCRSHIARCMYIFSRCIDDVSCELLELTDSIFKTNSTSKRCRTNYRPTTIILQEMGIRSFESEGL